jgi:hypothetical protein
MFNAVPALKQAFQVKKEQKMKRPTAIVFQFSRALGAIGLAVISSGCLAASSPNTFFEVTVRPGSSVLCMSDPCTVYFETPAGTGTHNILQHGTIQAGVATGGQRVLLGVYSNESLVFHVEGTDLPAAYLTVVGSP